MEIAEFEDRLKLHNWNYQNATNAIAWKTGQKEYARLIDLSFETREHRALFLQYKEKAGITDELQREVAEV